MWLKKIGYLDFTNKVQIGGVLWWSTGEKLLFSWWGTLVVEATLPELEALREKLDFKIVDNLSEKQFIVALFCKPFGYTGMRLIAAGPMPCVTSDAEELDLPWFHLSMTGAERKDFIDNVISVFKEHKIYVLTNIQTLECLEIKTSADLKK